MEEEVEEKSQGSREREKGREWNETEIDGKGSLLLPFNYMYYLKTNK